jgi:beta-glucosidase
VVSGGGSPILIAQIARRVRVVPVFIALIASLTSFTANAGTSPVALAAAPWPIGSDPCVMPCGTLSDPDLKALIGLMTVTEETTLIHLGGPSSGNGEAGSAAGIDRLGIPGWHWTDGPAGIRLGRTETAMPAPVGLIATWDRKSGYIFGSTIGNDARANGMDGWYGPMLNQVVIPTAGRNFETSGEDAYLAGQIGGAEVQGAQGHGLTSEIKHYLENDFENQRHSTSVYVDERTLHEGELQAFQAAINAGAMAVMCAYNRLNLFVTPPAAGQGDIFSCSHDLAQNQILKGREPFAYLQLGPPALGFQGQVGSDYGATHLSSDLINGLDSEQGTSSHFGVPIINAINGGGTAAIAPTNDMPGVPAYSSAQWKAALDNSAFHTLKMYNAAGYLEGTLYGSRSATSCAIGPSLPCTAVIPSRPDLVALRTASFKAAQSVAAKSATLLKNDRGLLPLTCADFTGSGVLVMGPTAIAAYTGGGGSAHVIPYDPVQGPFDALAAAATAKCGGAPVISYVAGYDLDGPIVLSSALTSAYYPNLNGNWTVPGGTGDPTSPKPGLLRQRITTASVASGSQPVFVDATGNSDRVDPTVDYTPVTRGTLPVNTGWRWTGVLTAPATPTGANVWRLKIFVSDQSSAQLFVDGLLAAQNTINLGAYPVGPNNSYASLSQTAKSHNPRAEGMQQAMYSLSLAPGQQINLDLRLITGSTVPSQIALRWLRPTSQSDSIAVASAAATGKNKVLDFIYDEGTEGVDRGGNAITNGLRTPGYQDAVAAAVAGVNPNTIVVLNTGDAIFMPWAASVSSILEMWYPGQRGGVATADVLVGNTNPGGKLPITFPDGSAPVGQRYPQDTQPSACGNNTADYGTASTLLPGNPGQCPLYPGIYTPGFLGLQLHGYRTINLSDQSLGGIVGNGIFTGYRWWDVHGYNPLFEFGRGLSYTQFAYSNLSVQPTVDGLDVTFRVTNSGSVTGDEVPQIYVGPPASAPVPLAVKALAGFTRVTMAPGESRVLTIHVGSRQLSYWSIDTHDWTLAVGARPLYVGSSSRDIRLQTTSAVGPIMSTVPGRE